MTRRGELEQAVMHVLWDSDAGVTAREALVALVDRKLALTTVMTVLARLCDKGLAVRDESVKPHRYYSASSREDHLAELMLDALGRAPDRRAVLTRFLGEVAESDKALLSKAWPSSSRE